MKQLFIKQRLYELIASAKAVKIAHEINPDLMIGCMMAMTPIYPYSCNPDDMLKAVGANHKRFWYLDVHARGIIPGYMKSFFKRKGYDLDLTQEDLEALKHGCVDYIGFSYYMSFATKVMVILILIMMKKMIYAIILIFKNTMGMAN